ncbi:hypothetical protein [Microvirga sp. VF16]|uniref:hypothetical protein n=1 Tax=Microvirga sp. VF16 TaxID=2807101 RepID=UPI00193D24C6|nr:hypothetical protein [Microvirga sp. VF16]QRM35021.1 hypothetical protein JO965_39155 [Microvirga sp. VF16]
MADETFSDVKDLVPISATGDEEPAPSYPEDVTERLAPAEADLPPPEGFTPKEIQSSIYGASVQIYNSRPDHQDYDGKVQAVTDAATLFALCGNKQLMATMFEEITAEHAHPYDVFARAQSEIEGMFILPSES